MGIFRKKKKQPTVEELTQIVKDVSAETVVKLFDETVDAVAAEGSEDFLRGYTLAYSTMYYLFSDGKDIPSEKVVIIMED